MRGGIISALFDFAVYGVLPHNRIVLFQFQALRRVFTVLLRHVARSSWQTAGFVLRALENDLEPIAFTFLCHCIGYSKF